MSKADEYFQEGKSHEDKGHIDKAIQFYEKALKEDENYKYALNNLGVLLEGQNNVKGAVEKYEKAIKANPDYHLPYYNLARIYQNENPKKAIDYCKKVLEIDKNYKDAYNLWGNILLDQNKTDDAREKYQKCLSIDPNFKYAYYNLARTYQNENPKKAIEYCLKALKIDVDYTYAYNLWGNALLYLNKTNEAREKYEKCISIDPDFKFAYYNLADSYQNENPRKAIDHCKKAIEIDKEYTDAYKLWGNILLAQNKNVEAREKYQQCIKIDENYQTAYYNIAISFLYENPSKAIEECKLGIGKFPDYHDLFWVWTSAIALLKENSGHIKELVAEVEKADSSTAYWRLGNFFNYNLKDFEKALDYYDKSASLSGHAGDMVLDYSNVYDAMGNLEKAFSILYEALDQQKQSTNIHIKHNIAHFLFKSGQYEKSRDLWKEVLIAYEKELNENMTFTNNAYNYLYFGNVHLEIFGNLDDAEEVFKEGLDKENRNLELLVALNRIYAEKDKRAIDTKTSLFWQRNSLVKNAEEIFNSSKYKHEEYYFQMAELYYLEENHDKAKSVIDDYFKLEFPLSSRWHNLKGQVFTAKGERSKAIDSFKQAIKLEGHNLSYRTNLANAYLKSDDFKEAEIEFRKVLKRDPNNVDALIGLGEINLNLYKDDSWGDIHFDAAENYLLQALRAGTSVEGSRRLDLFEPKGYKERVYKDLKLSDLYYSIGYLKYEKYKKNKISNRNQYLNESLDYMVKARKCNPDNLKAKNAENKIFKFINTYQKTTRTENIGAVLVTGLSLFIILACQYFFYFHNDNNEAYFLTKEHTEQLNNILELSDTTRIKKIEKIVNIPFRDKDKLLEALESQIGNEVISENRILLENMNFSKKVNEEQELLSATNYFTITFGAFAFLIVGLYLPKLLKLKVGVIELEKEKLSEVSDFTLSGIESKSKF